MINIFFCYKINNLSDSLCPDFISFLNLTKGNAVAVGAWLVIMSVGESHNLDPCCLHVLAVSPHLSMVSHYITASLVKLHSTTIMCLISVRILIIKLTCNDRKQQQGWKLSDGLHCIPKGWERCICNRKNF